MPHEAYAVAHPTCSRLYDYITRVSVWLPVKEHRITILLRLYSTML